MASLELIEGRKHAPQHLGRVLVLGLGKSGCAAAEYIAPLVGGRADGLCVLAGKRTPETERASEALAALDGVEVLFDTEQVPGSFDLCIASPGIPQPSPFYQGAAAASAEIIGEVEFAWRESAVDSRWVAVTGTNGKTTACALTARLLVEAGYDAVAVGNIGDTCIKAVASGGADVYVAEVSSYQLASTLLFAPDVAVILNITPDHLRWHGTFEAYREAKLKVLANLAGLPGAVAVLDATDDEVRAEVRRLRAMDAASRGFSYVPVGTKAGLSGDMRATCGSDNAAFCDADGMLHVAIDGRDCVLIRADELRIKGLHNVGNALAAASAALAIGANADAVARGLRAFEALEHRIEPCGTVRGTACYNDSKATNVDATLKAIAAFPEARPIVLLGGDDKGTDLTSLVEAARSCARAVVCFGAAGERFAMAFGAGDVPANGASGPAADGDKPANAVETNGAFSVLRASHLEDALDAALSIACTGDVVLLSPACASFDEFGSFEERGRAFKALVAARAAALGA